jgi:hypothetical protein
MSANELIERFEAERAEIQGKLADLETREVFLDKLITEIAIGGPAPLRYLGKNSKIPAVKEQGKKRNKTR